MLLCCPSLFSFEKGISGNFHVNFNKEIFLINKHEVSALIGEGQPACNVYFIDGIFPKLNNNNIEPESKIKGEDVL